MRKAFVTKLIGGQYTIKDLESNQVFTASARGKLRYVKVDKESKFNVNLTAKTKKEHKILVTSPKVGDHILYDAFEGHFYIEEVLERKNQLSRPDVVNVDQVLLVFSAIKPDFSFHLLDQFLVIMEKNHLAPIIVVSKIDLIDATLLESIKQDLKYYEAVGYPVYYINSKQRIGIDVLSHIFKNKLTVLAGQTGVGKSTLLNALLPELGLKTQEISKALGRGKHTTRHTELYYYNEGYIADTPGFSKIELEIDDENDLKLYYRDYQKLQNNCKFGGSCNHINEPKCAVIADLDQAVKVNRHHVYQQFFNQIKATKKKY